MLWWSKLYKFCTPEVRSHLKRLRAEWDNHLPPLFGDAVSDAVQDGAGYLGLLVGFLAASHCWLIFSLLSARTPRLLYSVLLSSLNIYPELFHHRIQHSPLLNFLHLVKIKTAYSRNLLNYIWKQYCIFFSKSMWHIYVAHCIHLDLSII